jgi:hypothetical protein
MLEELLTISKSQQAGQTVNANVDLTPIKELIESSNKHREQAENDLQKVVAIMSGDVEMIHRRVKDVRAVIGNSQSTGKIQNQLKKPIHWFKDSKEPLRMAFTISSIIE